QGNLLSAEKVKTYTELIMSDRIRMQASNRLGTQIEPGQIVATAQPQTVLITTTVTDTSPRKAQQIANAVSVEFVALVAQLEKPIDNAGAPPTVTAQLVQPAQFPTYPVSPRPAWNLAAGALLGLLLGYAIALLRHALTMSLSVDELRDATGSGVPGRLAYDSKHR
ncbi:MAG: YveK family protein, partial [Pseudonocardiaceae bacterium]